MIETKLELKYYLEIKEPCHESWEKMSPTEKGKFCSSCEKEVIDFVHVSDERLVEFLQKNDRKFCGRFTNEQLNRPISIERKKSGEKNYLKLAASFLLLNFVTHQSNADSESIKIEKTQGIHDVSDNSNSQDTIVIKGKLIDAKTGLAINGGRVHDYNGGIAESDKEGYFNFNIRTRNQNMISIYVEHCAYKETIVNISKDSLTEMLIIKLDSTTSLCNLPACRHDYIITIPSEKIVKGNMSISDGSAILVKRRPIKSFFRRVFRGKNRDF